MFAIVLWIFVLLIWIGNLIIRTRPSMKNTEGNGFQILVAVLFIMLAVVNIVGRIEKLNSDISSEVETIETSSPTEDFIQEEYYITDDTIY